MRPAVLVIFERGEDGLDLQALAATWPSVGVHEHPTEEAMRERWAAVSMVDIDLIARLSVALFDNEIIGPGGFVDPLAEGWLKRRTLAKIPRHLLPKDPKEKADEEPTPG